MVFLRRRPIERPAFFAAKHSDCSDQRKLNIMRPRVVKVDDRPFLQRRSLLGENISNGNWIVSSVLLLVGGGAIQQGWIMAAVGLGVAGALAIVWNPAVAKTATVVGVWLVAGGVSAWGFGLVCNSAFGSPAIGHVIGLVIAIGGIVFTID